MNSGVAGVFDPPVMRWQNSESLERGTFEVACVRVGLKLLRIVPTVV